MDVLCVLHERGEYGIARWPLIELSSAAGVPMKLVLELVSKEVLKGSDTSLSKPLIYTPRSGRKAGPEVILIPAQGGPIWFSSRMVRDEYVRTNRGISTRFGAEIDTETGAPSHSPTQRQGDGSSTSSPSPSSQENKNLKTYSSAGNGTGNGKQSVTIEDPDQRIARFQTKLAKHFGPRGWDIVYAACDRASPEHARSLALCQQASRDLGKGWPHKWPIS